MHAVDQRLRSWQSKPESWQQLLRKAFRRSAPIEFSGISVEILDGHTMAGLHGAYAPAEGHREERIYLNANWLASANAAAVEAVLLEELGHALDWRINGSNDTAGDEGAIFSALISGVAIPVVETTQNDHHTLFINGQRIAVEAAAPTLTTSASPQFTAIAANSGVPSGAVGTLVSALIDSGGSLNNFSDADGDSPAIAIISTNLNGGTLYYSTNNGTSWSDVGAVSASSARVLYADGNTRLAFAPAADYSGTISDLISFKAWDRNGAANGAGSIATAPSLTGTYDTSGSAQNVALSADGNTAFVADGSSGLEIINVSNPANPTLRGNFNTPGQAYDVALSADGNTAFVADISKGLQIINVTNLASPTFIGTYDTIGFAYEVSLSGNTAFVADGNRGLKVIDVSDPNNPSRIGLLNTTGFARGITLSNDGKTAFVADGHQGLRIIDVNDPTSPSLTSTFNTSGSAEGVSLSTDGNTAFVADGNSGLQIINVSNLASPTLRGNFNTSGHAFTVTLSSDGNTAFVADGPSDVEEDTTSSGLKIIDVSNPASPSQIGLYNTSGRAYHAALSADGNTAFVADEGSGLQIIDVDFPPHFSTASDTASIEISSASIPAPTPTPSGDDQGDSTPPELRSAVTSTEGNQVILTYDELLESVITQQSAFKFYINDTEHPIQDIKIHGHDVVLSTFQTIKNDDIVTVSYLKPTGHFYDLAIQDLARNKASSLPRTPVANRSNIPGTPPILTSASTSTDGKQVILTYDESLLNRPPTTADFHLTVDNGQSTIRSLSIVDKTVVLNLKTPVVQHQSLTLAYNDPSQKNDLYTIQDLTGNDAISFNLSTIKNISTRLNQPPLFIDQTLRIRENLTGGTIIHDLNDAFTDSDLDRDQQPISYTIRSGNSSGVFSIDPATGQLRIAAGQSPDFETNSRHILNITATDGHNPTRFKCTIAIIDLDDTTSISSPTKQTQPPLLIDINSIATQNNNNAYTIDPQANTCQAILNLNNDATGNDLERSGEPLSYSIASGNNKNLFAINSSGVLSYTPKSSALTSARQVFPITIDITSDARRKPATIPVLLTLPPQTSSSQRCNKQSLKPKGRDYRLLGRSCDDILHGRLSYNALHGFQGHDRLHGQAANDSLYGGTGNDSLLAGAGEDLLSGHKGHDLLQGRLGNDNLDGGNGNDSLQGGRGHDTLHGGPGNDSLIASSKPSLHSPLNNSPLNSSKHNNNKSDLNSTTRNTHRADPDTLHQRGTRRHSGHNSLNGGRGHDTLQGGNGNDSLIGGSGADLLNAHHGHDLLKGRRGHDRLHGRSGNDTLKGGRGNDTLKGGPGADHFLLTPGLDRILDFNPQQGDRIRSKHLLDLRITQHHNHLLLSDPIHNIHTSLLNTNLEQLLNAQPDLFTQ